MYGFKTMNWTFLQRCRHRRLRTQCGWHSAPVTASLVVLLLAATPSSYGKALDAALVQRGRYLALAGDCISCHTREGGAPFAGGLDFHTPFGIIYSANITPDPQTGIGQWSETEFARALRQGIGKHGEQLYPVFPYSYFTKISDADVAALYAFFRVIPAVRNVPPANDMKFPFGDRRLLWGWKRLYFHEGRFVQDKAKSPEWNRGAYLVQGLGHCGACHTPRDHLGGEKTEQFMTGGVYEEYPGRPMDWSAANLTSAGLKAWSLQDLTNYFRLGYSLHAAVHGPIISDVLNSTRNLTLEDEEAIATYLKDIPPNTLEDPPAPSHNVMTVGKNVYSINCSTCHLPTGAGSPITAPPLAGSSVVLTPDPASMINIVLRGPILPNQPPSEAYQHRKWQRMPAFGDKLSDEDAAALLSYVRNAWGNQQTVVTADQVAKQR